MIKMYPSLKTNIYFYLILIVLIGKEAIYEYNFLPKSS